MAKSVTVEVIVDNLKDSKYYNQPLNITRRDEKITIVQKLLQKGDIFETDYEHAKYLEDCKYVQIVKDKKIKFDEE